MTPAFVFALALQMDPAAFAGACMAGGGAPATVQPTSNRDTARDIVLADGAQPVSVLVSLNSVTPRGRVFAYADDRPIGEVRAGGAVILTGRRVHLLTGSDQTVQYCLNLRRA